MNVHFFGIALLVSLIVCVPMIVASVIALILRKRPLSWILYGAGTGLSALLIIAGNVYKGQFMKNEFWKGLIQNIEKTPFNNIQELNQNAYFQGILAENSGAKLPIMLYYYCNWSMTIALVLFMVLALAFLLLLIITINKKRENFVRNELAAQYQSISFK
jgi:hypothetical protein